MDNRKPKYLWEENKRRLAQKHQPYNPLSGEGSPLPRFRFELSKEQFLWLPEQMKDEPVVASLAAFSSLEQYARAKGWGEVTPGNVQDTLNVILPLRFKYDFEFWASTCVVIRDKISGEEMLFKLNRSQRKLLARLERQRLAGKPIRAILLKARQWGGSTLIQIYMAWIQIFWKVNWNSAVIADVEDQANNIRGMYSLMANRHPDYVQSVTLKPYERSQKTRVMKERGNIIAVGSMQKPEGLRSFDFKMAHLSETGLWKETKGKKPEDLAQAIRAGIPNVPYSMVVVESTAKGVGNFFHREWLSAKNHGGLEKYEPVFVGWHEIEMYEEKVTQAEIGDLLKRFTEYHWWLWDYCGATLDAIKWYMNFKERENYDDWRMQSEFPSDDVEAFQSTGHRAIPQPLVAYARSTCEPPALVGEVTGRAINGEQALQSLRFVEDHTGRLQIWALPDPLPVKNRYCVFVDIGGRTRLADYSVIKVFDRYWMLEGGKVEVVALWRGHLDQDLVAWKAAQIGAFYNDALLAVESNSLRKEKQDTEGSHFLTVLNEIAPFYPNLYTRTSPDRVREGAPTMYGFHTGEGTRTMIITTLIAALRDQAYTERHAVTCDEMDTFEVTATGKFEAVEGNKDDCVITTAGGVWLALKHMEPVQLIEPRKAKNKSQYKNEAVF